MFDTGVGEAADAGWDGRVTWTTPTRHRYTSHPHDYRPDLPAAPRSGPETGPDPPPS